MNTLHHDGVVAISDFLSTEQFAVLQAEVRDSIARHDKLHPPASNDVAGFGARRPFTGGFDRWDGGTLNRFISIDKTSTPGCARFVTNRRLAKLCSHAATYRYHPEKIWINEITHVNKALSDEQQVFHRDTFHSAIKIWFFTEEVTPEHGPFAYVLGSHRLSFRRQKWEYRRSCEASNFNRDGAFRIGIDEMQRMGLPAPTRFTVAANTLVMADIRGFHRREEAAEGARRVGLHASFRPSPFVPIRY